MKQAIHSHMRVAVAAAAMLLAGQAACANTGALAFPAAARQAQASADFAQGEVRRVDKSAGKITLKHGEIKSLDMPPMTMAFSVVDKALLEQVKVGDKVQFRAANQDGRMTVTEIQTAR